ncbi:hypothetical protein [Roseibium sp.]|uniref:hypothetical protein n=1 Tax=Roseibium sp. TaxID=1936156 RepID=UPI003B50C527
MIPTAAVNPRFVPGSSYAKACHDADPNLAMALKQMAEQLAGLGDPVGLIGL